MAKEAAITVRLPLELKRRLVQRAKKEHRSISAQVQQELELAVARGSDPSTPRKAAVGLFRGARVPSDEDFLQVRATLWRRLGQQRG
jgi:hypothetical protein